jgi:hypothetical protein
MSNPERTPEYELPPPVEINGEINPAYVRWGLNKILSSDRSEKSGKVGRPPTRAVPLAIILYNHANEDISVELLSQPFIAEQPNHGKLQSNPIARAQTVISKFNLLFELFNIDLEITRVVKYRIRRRSRK